MIRWRNPRLQISFCATMTRYFSISFSFLWLPVLVFAFFLSAGFFNASGQSSSSVSSTISISVEVPDTSGTSTPSSPGITIPTPGSASVIFEGFTSPDALVYFYAGGSLLATDKADPDGTFARTLSVNSGISDFGIAAKDKTGLLTSTSNLSLNIISFSTTTVSNIFLSPTLETDNSEPRRGAPVNLSGSTFPGSKVFLTLDNQQIAEIQADISGLWRYRLVTGNLKGNHTIGAKAIISSLGLLSTPSPVISLKIKEGVCPGPDLNEDGAVDIVDLSIMLFYWREQNPKNPCVDLNADGVVDMADLSLLMYAWTGNGL